jgi:hypothetical protein
MLKYCVRPGVGVRIVQRLWLPTCRKFYPQQVTAVAAAGSCYRGLQGL